MPLKAISTNSLLPERVFIDGTNVSTAGSIFYFTAPWFPKVADKKRQGRFPITLAHTRAFCALSSRSAGSQCRSKISPGYGRMTKAPVPDI
jgi:hypothetical protein